MALPQKKILIVEDEKPMARALELKLAHEGFAVGSATDGEQALAILAKDQIDLILLDLVLPKLDGFAVLAKLAEGRNTTPVIVLTNLSQGEDEEKAKKLGAKAFFIKSNTPIAEIVATVKQFFI